MREIELNGKRMTSETMAREYLFDMFEFPEYYGEDLEAIYDALADITEETRVEIINREYMEHTSFGSRLIWIFEDAATDNDKLTLIWTEEEFREYD